MSHIIKTQKLQLDIPKADSSWSIQENFKQVFYEQVVNKLEKVCDEFDVDLEIDRLEIDVGEVSLSDIDSLWVSKVENSFREQIQQLAKAGVNTEEAASRNTAKASHTKLELITYFLKSGLLPWWSEKFKPVVLSQILSELLAEKPQEVTAVLITTFYDQRTIKRFISQFEYKQQQQVISLLIGASPVKVIELNTLKALTKLIDKLKNNSEAKTVKQLLPVSFLATIIEGQKKSFNVNEQFKNLLLKIAEELAVENAVAFFQSIKASVKSSKSATKQYHPLTDQAVIEVAEKLIEALPPAGQQQVAKQARRGKEQRTSIDQKGQERKKLGKDEATKVDSSTSNKQIKDSDSQQPDAQKTKPSNKPDEQKRNYSEVSHDDSLLKEKTENQQNHKLDKNIKNEEDVEHQSKEQIKKSKKKIDVNKGVEHEEKNQLSEAAYRNQKEIEKEDKQLKENKQSKNQVEDHAAEEQAHKIKAQEEKGLKEESFIGKTNKKSDPEVLPEEMTQESKLQQTAEILKNLNKAQTHQSANADSPKFFEEAELPKEIYIENAGLVLLWPYLPRFFDNMELTQKGAFKSEVDRKKAVILTQYLVEAEPALHEYQLLLNKILCDFALNETIEKEPINGEEKEECESLLESVIQNWSVIKNTSVPGFRQIFLQRKGKLTNQGNSWLLQVEKETFDMLLEQLPWQISVVKLHWMDKPIYVEW